MKSTEFSTPSTPTSSNASPIQKFLSRYAIGLCILIALPAHTGCASSSKKTTPPPNPVAMKLPKPAPMRVAADTSSRRKAPPMPKIVDTTPSSDTSTATSDLDLIPPPDKTTVVSSVPKFIENEQPQDFFQGAGDVPVGETVLGSFFDSVFRPANPPNQPVSSTSYTVE
jgi:hypothetical protein